MIQNISSVIGPFKAGERVIVGSYYADDWVNAKFADYIEDGEDESGAKNVMSDCEKTMRAEYYEWKALADAQKTEAKADDSVPPIGKPKKVK